MPALTLFGPEAATRSCCWIRPTGSELLLPADTIQKVSKLRKAGKTVPEIVRHTGLSKARSLRRCHAPEIRSLKFPKSCVSWPRTRTFETPSLAQ
jgi:hypothetical protein